jgi:hypothetical protein
MKKKIYEGENPKNINKTQYKMVVKVFYHTPTTKDHE